MAARRTAWHSASDQLCLVLDDSRDEDERLLTQANAGNFLKECVLAQRHFNRGDDAAAYKHYSAAARRGSHVAQYNAGLMLEKGRGTDASLEQALQLYRRAARRGQVEAKFRLGYHLTQTDAVVEGVGYIHASANEGSAGAMFDYGMMCLHGVSVEEDTVKGAVWLQRAVTAGYVRAAFELAVYYSRPSSKEGDAQLAVTMASHAAGEGHPLAQDLLGQFYLKGVGAEADAHMAYECFRTAADHGVLSSKRDLAMLLEVGQGCDQDVGKAVDLFRECSDAGDVLSKFRLALCQARGVGGLAADKKLGRKLMREASDEGCITAQVYVLSNELAEGDRATKVKAALAVVAADASHPGRAEAIRALIGLGLIDACGGCKLSKYELAAPLKKCATCKSVKYCSKGCQEADWTNHRIFCVEGKSAEKE